MRRIYPFIFVLVFAIVAVSLVTPVASNVSALECGALPIDLCTDVDKEAGTIGETSIWRLLRFIITVLTAGAGILAVCGIIYGAVMYASAGGNQDQVKKARTILRDVVIGVVLFASMLALLQWLVPGGVLEGNAAIPKSTTRPGSPTNPSDPSNPSDPTNPTNPETPPKQNPNSPCYHVSNPKQPKGKIYHIPPKPAKTPYAFENSIQGVKYAGSNGYSHIDIDLQVTKDGVIVATHTETPLHKDPRWGGFRDPQGKYKIGSGVKVKNMTWAEVSRLVHKDGYKISKVEDIIKQAKASGVGLRFELKESTRWQQKIPEIAKLVNKHGVVAHFASINTKVNAKKNLELANKLGFWTRMLKKSGSGFTGTWHEPKLDASRCK